MKYLCYDTALNETYTLVKLLKKYPRYISLFAGTDDEPIWDAAPYLFEAEDNFYELKKDPFIKLDRCIVFETKESLVETCRFLQYYIYQWPGNSSTYFRIWDARVLLRHLPQWEVGKRQQFFGFFNCFYTENVQQDFFDKWEPARLYVPVAAPLLKTDVLQPYSEPAQEKEEQLPQTSQDSVAQKEEDNKVADQDVAKEPPKKRRFFIE